MGSKKRNLDSVSLRNKTVLLRVDYDVPVDDKGNVLDTFLLRMSLPTIWKLLEHGCKIVVVSHRGRPGGKHSPKLSMRPVAQQLATMLDMPVRFVDACVGDKPRMAVKLSPNKSIIMLENICFHPGEEANDYNFARELQRAVNADYMVHDAFSLAHTRHASTHQLPLLVPAVTGKLLEHEIARAKAIKPATHGPVVAVIGGMKLSDKIDLIEHLIDIADTIVLGGAVANTVMHYRGLPVGKSTYEHRAGKLLDRMFQKAVAKWGYEDVWDHIITPIDVAVAMSPRSRATRMEVPVERIPTGPMILDMGVNSTRRLIGLVEDAGVVIWSGPLGYVQNPTFAYATKQLAMALKAMDKWSVHVTISGEDTVRFITEWDRDLGRTFSHISTGGRSGILLMANRPLPGIEHTLDDNRPIRYTKRKEA